MGCSLFLVYWITDSEWVMVRNIVLLRSEELRAIWAPTASSFAIGYVRYIDIKGTMTCVSLALGFHTG